MLARHREEDAENRFDLDVRQAAQGFRVMTIVNKDHQVICAADATGVTEKIVFNPRWSELSLMWSMIHNMIEIRRYGNYEAV